MASDRIIRSPSTCLAGTNWFYFDLKPAKSWRTAMLCKVSLRLAVPLLGVLLSPAVAAAASDGVMPYDDLACRDKAILNGFQGAMEKTGFLQFRAYINN